MTELTLSFNE